MVVNIIQAIAGYKTYFIATAAAVDAFGSYLGYWDENRMREIVESLFTIIFLRTGIQKSGPVVGVKS